MILSRAISRHLKMLLVITVMAVILLELLMAVLLAESNRKVRKDFAGSLPAGVFQYQEFHAWKYNQNVKQEIAGVGGKQVLQGSKQQEMALIDSTVIKATVNWQVTNIPLHKEGIVMNSVRPIDSPLATIPSIHDETPLPTKMPQKPLQERIPSSQLQDAKRTNKFEPKYILQQPQKNQNKSHLQDANEASLGDITDTNKQIDNFNSKPNGGALFDNSQWKNGNPHHSDNKGQQSGKAAVSDIYGHLANRSSHLKQNSNRNEFDRNSEAVTPKASKEEAKNTSQFIEPHKPFDKVRSNNSMIDICAGLDRSSFQTEHFCLEDVANLTQQYFKMTKYGWCYVKGAELIDRRRECYCVEGWHGQHCSVPDVVERSDYPYEYGVAVTNTPRRLILAFPFNFEFELLEAKLEEFGNLVDVFVILESNFTASGKRKPLYLMENLKNGYLKTYQHKILHVTLDFFPSEAYRNGWVVDELIRHYLGDQVLQRIHGLRSDDVFIISDADEMPVWETMFFLKFHYGYPEPIAFHLRHNVFGFFWLGTDFTSRVFGACSIDMLRRVFDGNPYHLRDATRHMSRHPEQVNTYKYKHGGRVREWSFGSKESPIGWHCSWCFEAERIQHKLLSAPLSDLPRWGSDPAKTKHQYINALIQTGTWFDDITKLVPVNDTDNKWYAPRYFLAHSNTAQYLMKPVR